MRLVFLGLRLRLSQLLFEVRLRLFDVLLLKGLGFQLLNVLFQTSDLVLLYFKFQLQPSFVFLLLFNLLADFFVYVNVLALLVQRVLKLLDLGIFATYFKFKLFVALVKTHDFLLHLLLLTLQPLVGFSHLFQVRAR